MKPKFEQQRCLNIAHRGASRFCPENTAVACRAAAEAGAHMWEFDLRLSSDGELVVIHDSSTLRTSDFRSVFPVDMSPEVDRMTLDQLQLLDFGAFARSSVAGKKDCRAERSPERILTAKEALDLSRKTGLLANAEIKDCGPESAPKIVSALLGAIRSTGMYDRVLVSSFEFSVLRILRRMDPGLRIGVLFDTGDEIDPRVWSGIYPASCHIPLELVGPELVRFLHRLGPSVYAYTADKTGDMRRCLEAGVDGIFTNCPERLGSLLAGMHPELI
ncbi:MAG: glycerophosphodiester phosphodiesterase [Desulfonatronovibrionaceae bacterium]